MEALAEKQKRIEDETLIKEAVRQIRIKAKTDIKGAIVDSEALDRHHPEHFLILNLLCKLYVRNGNIESALSLSSRAISKSIITGDAKTAVETFMALGTDRRKVRLGHSEFERLAQALTARRCFDDAVWCLQGSAATGGDTAKVEKGIIAAAESAKKAGDNKKAMQIFAFFIKKYPESSFVGYCEAEHNKLKRITSG